MATEPLEDEEGRPVVYDLYCGLGGWTEAFLAEGYRCIGFDTEAHEYAVPDIAPADGSKGTKPVEKRGWTQGCAVSLGMEGANNQPRTKILRYPGELILRDVRSIHGSELKDATIIVASPPCQAYSYRAMPWKRAKALPPPDNTLFNECFRIQREAIEAAGHHIPLIVENVRGAQKWVGRARWNYGSFYLWGDVPALMPMTFKREVMKRSVAHRANGETNFHGSALRAANQPGEFSWNRDESLQEMRRDGRKAASAMIAKIPYPLALHIARTFKSHVQAIAEQCFDH